MSGLNAVRCIATNAWRGGEASGEFNKHVKTDYRGYSSSKEFTSRAILALKAVKELSKRIGKAQEGTREADVISTEADAAGADVDGTKEEKE